MIVQSFARTIDLILLSSLDNLLRKYGDLLRKYGSRHATYVSMLDHFCVGGVSNACPSSSSKLLLVTRIHQHSHNVISDPQALRLDHLGQHHHQPYG